MAVVAGGAIGAGIVAAIAGASKIVELATGVIGAVSDGLRSVATGTMTPEQFAAAMAEAQTALEAARAAVDPLRDRVRAKDKEIDEGWDPRLSDPE